MLAQSIEAVGACHTDEGPRLLDLKGTLLNHFIKDRESNLEAK